MTERWPAPHSHHWTRWSLPELCERKVATGTRVSLVLPARNEAATVGTLVSRLRAELMGDLALVDQLVVIDSDSTDDTAAVAAAAGAEVHRCAQVRPDLGTAPGKGEALWKSLFVTTGDVLVFMDADLVEWGPHFVPGLLGPLLTDAGVQLVKGCYERPLLDVRREERRPDGQGGQGGQGGRVTELLARPALALLFPALGGVEQPLAGEWAVRRDHMASLSVPTGYAVDLAVLVDTAVTLGIEAVAQVDLGRRAHRHHALADLGPMAVQCLAALQSRAGLPVDDPVLLRQFQPTPGGRTSVVREVPLDERPPAATCLGGER